MTHYVHMRNVLCTQLYPFDYVCAYERSMSPVKKGAWPCHRSKTVIKTQKATLLKTFAAFAKPSISSHAPNAIAQRAPNLVYTRIVNARINL